MEELLLFPNEENNEWINKYNELVVEVKAKEAENKALKEAQPKRNDKEPSIWSGESIGIHHIIPKKIRPDLVKDKNNLLYVSIADHCRLHYYLWKSNPIYAKHFWFIMIAARKWGWWDLPGGDEEYEMIKNDLKKK